MDNPLSNRTTKAPRTTVPSWKPAYIQHTLSTNTPEAIQRRTTVPLTKITSKTTTTTTTKEPEPSTEFKTESVTLVDEVTDIAPTTMHIENRVDLILPVTEISSIDESNETPSTLEPETDNITVVQMYDDNTSQTIDNIVDDNTLNTSTPLITIGSVISTDETLIITVTNQSVDVTTETSEST